MKILISEPLNSFITKEERWTNLYTLNGWDEGNKLHWDWDKWDEYNDDVITTATTSSSTPTEVIEVFTEEGQPLAIVDDSGDVLWLDDDCDDTEISNSTEEMAELIEKYGPDKEFACIDCDQTLSLKDIRADGTCPYCSSLLFPPDTYQEDNDGDTLLKCPSCWGLYSEPMIERGRCPYCYEPVVDEEPDEICPYCGEDKYIVDPRHTDTTEDGIEKADSECVRCGCFWSNPDVIHGFNTIASEAYYIAKNKQEGSNNG
jgi:hypothetical protein